MNPNGAVVGWQEGTVKKHSVGGKGKLGLFY